MWRKPDEDGRYPLSHAEYQALRSIFGAKNALEQTHHDLERRVRLIPGGWRDFRLVMTLIDKLMAAVLGTIPQKKNCWQCGRNCPEPSVKSRCRA